MIDFAYLDCAAGTPIRPESLAAMMPYLTEHHGNPSGTHAVARRARRGLDDARDIVAELTGASPHGVVFTSGGTESDNLVIHGVLSRRGGTALCLGTEHHAILDPVVAHGGVLIDVAPSGLIDLDDLKHKLVACDNVSIVSVMAVNNETGVVQPMADIAAMVRSLAPDAVLHTDAVQAAHWLDLRSIFPLVDAMSLAGHKFGGPKGSGVLLLSDRVEIAAQILGGGQEHERRSGTQNVAAVAGFAEALRITDTNRGDETRRIAAFRGELEQALVAVPNISATVDADLAVPGICHLTVQGRESEEVLVALERGGVMAAAASSCASGALQPSHVLTAMGRSREEAGGALRLSMAFCTTQDEIDRAVAVVPDAAIRDATVLRRMTRGAAAATGSQL